MSKRTQLTDLDCLAYLLYQIDIKKEGYDLIPLWLVLDEETQTKYYSKAIATCGEFRTSELTAKRLRDSNRRE